MSLIAYKKMLDIVPQLNELSEETLDKINLFMCNTNIDENEKNLLLLLINEIKEESKTLKQYE